MQQNIFSFFREFPTAQALAQHSYCREQCASLRSQGENFLQTGFPALSLSDFSLYWSTGDREHYQRHYFDRRGHLLVFSLLTKLYPEEAKWHTALDEAIWGICSETFWSVPAHFLIADGVPLPYADYDQNLDLFACETAFALAEVLSLHRDTLSPLLQSIIFNNVHRRVFAPFSSPTRIQRFENMENNWSAVCASAIGGAALHLLPDDAFRSALIDRCMSALQVYLSSFGNDGICTEGVDYWSYGFGFFVCFADLLAHVTCNAVDLLSQPHVQAIAASQLAFYLGGTATLSFSDGSHDSRFRMGLSCYLQKRVPHAALPALSCAAPILKDRCYRYCLAVRDFLWYDASLPFGASTQSMWYEDAKWFISRKNDSILAIKAGHNGEAHNHNDCGSFVFCKNGALLLCDFGAGLYDAAYFSEARYSIFVNRTQSHNLPLPAGHEQCAGSAFSSRVISHSFSPNQDSFCVDLTHCYPVGAISTLLRTVCHLQNGTITLTDEASFFTDETLTETLVSQTPIVLQNNCALFSAQGETLCVPIPQGWQAQSTVQPYPGHDGLEHIAYLLRLHNAQPAKKVQLHLIFSAMDTKQP